MTARAARLPSPLCGKPAAILAAIAAAVALTLNK